MSKAAVQTRRENAVIRYLRETRAEMRKVTWPTREEAIRLTLIVLAVTVAMALILFVFDTLFAQLIGLLVK